MGELRFLFYLLVGLAKVILWLLNLIFTIIGSAYRKFVQIGTEELERRKQLEAQRAPSRLQAQPMQRAARTKPDVAAALGARARELIKGAQALSALAAERRATERFVPTLDAIVDRITAAAGDARRGDDKRHVVEQDLQRDDALLQIIAEMVTERRSGLADLLADTDALATASYAPIVEYCGNRRIPLSSDRAATIVGGDKLFFLSVDDPTGLAAIVLPDSFRSELIAWPAIAHEIAHDFYRSVAGLPTQLHRALHLGDNIAVPRFDGDHAALERELADVPARATLAWQEELFADAFGTMMLGPAYVETMAALFATPDDPARATVILSEPGQKVPRYEEHPPGHVRVLVACSLLGKMGYGKVADALEARWRKRHGAPTQLYVPLIDGRYALIPEAPTVERAAKVGEVLYLSGLDCLRGQPLRSIPGLDFGPREHTAAERIARELAAGRPVLPEDPRLLVAGAVLATIARPQLARDVYLLARDAIGGLSESEAPTRADAAPRDTTAFREAFLVAELLGPPISRRPTSSRR